MKKAEFWNIWPKKLNQNKQQSLFVFKNEINDTILKIFLQILAKLTKNFAKISENVNKNMVNSLYFSQKFKPR